MWQKPFFNSYNSEQSTYSLELSWVRRVIRSVLAFRLSVTQNIVYHEIN